MKNIDFIPFKSVESNYLIIQSFKEYLLNKKIKKITPYRINSDSQNPRLVSGERFVSDNDLNIIHKKISSIKNLKIFTHGRSYENNKFEYLIFIDEDISSRYYIINNFDFKFLKTHDCFNLVLNNFILR